METINRKINKKIRTLYAFAFVFIFVAGGFFLLRNRDMPQTGPYVKIGGVDVSVEFALDPVAQAKGLSGRDGLEENTGLLFIFDNPGKQGFWMKDMKFPIDIIWIGEDMRIAYIKDDARHDGSLEVFSPDKDAKYVLEVQSGFSKNRDLKVGDLVEMHI